MNLKDELKFLRSVIDDSVNEIFMFDADTFLFTYANTKALDNIGYEEDEIKKLTPVDIKPDYNREEFLKILEPLTKQKQDHLVFETTYMRKDSSTYDVEVRLHLSTIGEKKQFIVFSNDISERKKYLKDLENTKEKFRTITEVSLMGIFIYKEKLVYVNDAFLEIGGYSYEEVMQMHAWSFAAKENQEFIKSISLRRLKGEEFPKVYNDMVFYRKDGTARTMRIMAQTIFYEGSYAGMGSLMDITDIQENKEKLKKLATTDMLTGIYNRYKTNMELDIQLLRVERFDEPFSILMIDIDHFKNINDTYGHDIGDNVLKELSSLILTEIRGVDCFGRWGGEEFLMILQHQKKDEAIVVAKKLNNLIKSYSFDKVGTVTISIGVSEYIKSDTKESLLKRVDTALYKAKDEGRDKVVFT